MRPAEYQAMFYAEQNHWWYRALHRLVFQTLEQELPDWRQKSILDAGCGTGAILEQLGNPARNVGVDLAPEAIALCRKRGLTNVVQADVAALPFGDNNFDAVISSSVIYHQWVNNPAEVLRELGRVLRPGGLLLLNVPAFQFLHSAHDEAVMTARRFRRKDVRRLVQQSGFLIRRITYWTAFLFPVALLARTFGLSGAGRDFGDQEYHPSWRDRLFWMITSTEVRLLRRISLPFGVDLFAVAIKKPPA